MRNLKGLGELSCDFTGEYSTGGIPSQVTVLCGKHREEIPRKKKSKSGPALAKFKPRKTRLARTGHPPRSLRLLENQRIAAQDRLVRNSKSRIWSRATGRETHPEFNRGHRERWALASAGIHGFVIIRKAAAGLPHSKASLCTGRIRWRRPCLYSCRRAASGSIREARLAGA